MTGVADEANFTGWGILVPIGRVQARAPAGSRCGQRRRQPRAARARPRTPPRATHQLRIDNRLVAAINGELDDDDEHRESELSPKDIQARLRAGDSVEQVAKAARIPVAADHDLRDAGHLRARADHRPGARGAVLQRPAARSRPPRWATVGRPSASTEIAGLQPETVEWDARRREDGAWVVELATPPVAAPGPRRGSGSPPDAS